MLRRHFEEHLSPAFSLAVHEHAGDSIVSGELRSLKHDGVVAPIHGGIPRFVEAENYAANFGFQWRTFPQTQLDSSTGLPLSFNRFWNNTRWKPKNLHGAKVLEVGCGAGRFTEVMLEAGARVVSVDYSVAVDVNFQNNRSKGDLFALQADVYALPFEPESFDYVFCFGVIQHTPDPRATFAALLRMVRPGGQLSVDFYRKMRLPAPFYTPKYLWRPWTRKMDPERLFRLVEWYVPRWLPIDTVIKRSVGRVPKIGRIIAGLSPIPCWNYVGVGLSPQQRKEWAILDTFDALGASYDFPMTLEEVQELVQGFESAEQSVFPGSNGIVANLRKSCKNASYDGPRLEQRSPVRSVTARL